MMYSDKATGTVSALLTVLAEPQRGIAALAQTAQAKLEKYFAAEIRRVAEREAACEAREAACTKREAAVSEAEQDMQARVAAVKAAIA